MKIVVIGRNPMGHLTVARAARFWSSTPKLVEVVDVAAGEYTKTVDRQGNLLAEPIPCVEGDDPPPVPVKMKNATTGRDDVRLMPDPERIGRNSFVELENDSRITIKQTDTVSEDAADAAVGAARAEVSRLSTENLELKARVAQLESGEVLKAAFAELAALKGPTPAEPEKATAKSAGKRG